MFNQAIDQTTTFDYHFVIVVSNERERLGYFNKLMMAGDPTQAFNQYKYIGAIARLNTYTTVLQACSEKEAFVYMKSQARKCLDNKHVVKRLEKKTDNYAFNWLMGIRDISDVTAELVVKELNLYTLEDMMAVTYEDLVNIHGIGDKTANIILNSVR